jgi:predicted TIM-barrel fold metal-dependent hydrolase
MTPRTFGPYQDLRRDYPAGEYAADARASGVTKSVHVQAHVAPGKAVDEVARAAASGQQAGLVQAVVAFADLAAADVRDLPDRELGCSAVRGIRQQLHWHPNPAWRYAPVPDLMLHPGWHALPGHSGTGRRREHAADLPLRAESAAVVRTPGTTR